jgi:hypothetical protein
MVWRLLLIGMDTVFRLCSLGLAAGLSLSALSVGAGPAEAIDRGELLEQMKRMRPADLIVLEAKPMAGGDYTLAIFAIKGDDSDPDLRRYKLWKEYPNDLVVPTESVNCSTTEPLRVTRDKKAIYIRRLNPGGVVNDSNREDHLVWWAACVPAEAGKDPATLADQARQLGYSGLLTETTETLRVPGP